MITQYKLFSRRCDLPIRDIARIGRELSQWHHVGWMQKQNPADGPSSGSKIQAFRTRSQHDVRLFLQHDVQCVGIAAIFRIHNSFQPRYRHHSQVGLMYLSLLRLTAKPLFDYIHYYSHKGIIINIYRNTYEIQFYFIFVVFVSIKVRLRAS